MNDVFKYNYGEDDNNDRIEELTISKKCSGKEDNENKAIMIEIGP